MEIRKCPHCGIEVVPTAKNACPSCRREWLPETSTPSLAETGSHDVIEAIVLETEAAPCVSPPKYKLLVPAILLTTVAALSALNSVYLMVRPEPTNIRFDDPTMQAAADRGQRAAQAAGSLPVLIMYIFMLAGGVAMILRQHWGIALAAAIVALIPCSAIWLLGLPVGIWSLIVLNLHDVKVSFR